MKEELTRTLEGRSILLGVSGSIAAYKAADLCSRLGKLGADVHVVLTPAAAQFVGPATFRVLTRNPVVSDVFDEPHARRIAHIDLAQSADLVLVAPATADILARMAHGLADDMLATCLLATPHSTPLLVAPAMNTAMWEHPATRANLETLRGRGVQIIEPGYGLLACQDVGQGKLAEVDEVVQAVTDRLAPFGDYAGVRLLVTAGATREPLDPVRFLSNRSSGKMGYAIAEEARARGAEVTLVSGYATIAAPAGVELVRINTADEMLAACVDRFPHCDILIAAAAVADYTPIEVAAQKIKKPDVDPDADTLTLTLRRTPHILATLAARKRPGQVLIGFAAETQDLLDNARRKPYANQLDLIVANDVTAAGAGFDVDTNIATLLWPDGRQDSLPLLSKRAVAARLLDAVLPCLHQKRP
jgi:phosphopantothenoylcysteine decarboxylase/phosphopantothenate--cysteine ligase